MREECSGGADSMFGFPCDKMQQCADAATSSQFGAFMTCATLLFAMIGCLTRIKKVVCGGVLCHNCCCCC